MIGRKRGAEDMDGLVTKKPRTEGWSSRLSSLKSLFTMTGNTSHGSLATLEDFDRLKAQTESSHQSTGRAMTSPQHESDLLFQETFSQRPHQLSSQPSPHPTGGQASQSSSQPTPPPRPPPPTHHPRQHQQIRRPDVHHTRSRDYNWERSSSSSSSSSLGSDRPRSNLRKPMSPHTIKVRMARIIDGAMGSDPKLKKSGERVKSMLTGGHLDSRPATEQAFYRNIAAGTDSKETFKRMLKPKETLEEKIEPRPRTYSPTRKRRTAEIVQRERKHLPDRNVEDLLKDLQVKDEAVKKRLSGLNKDQKDIVRAAFNDPGFYARCVRDEVYHRDVERLRPQQWLNDSIINFYGTMIQQRADAEGQKLHFFSSYFYDKLSTDGYPSVRRWTKKVDIFEKDVVLFPVNLRNTHWTAGAINLKRKTIEYYDSMGDGYGNRHNVYKYARDYLEAEHKDKKGSSFDFTGWKDAWNPSTPQQDNGSDCGIFSCQTLENLARGVDLINKPWSFGPENMPHYRDLMVLEIKQTKLEPR